MYDFLFNKVRAVKKAADEGSPDTFILIGLRCFFPKIFIDFWFFSLVLIT